MTRWVIRFRRPLQPISKPKQPLYFRVIGWKPIPESIVYKVGVHYWDSKNKWWTSADAAAYRYSTRERAEKAAFKIVATDHTLIGELEIVESEPPVKQVWKLKP